jgi:hypothetical protein
MSLVLGKIVCRIKHTEALDGWRRDLVEALIISVLAASELDEVIK